MRKKRRCEDGSAMILVLVFGTILVLLSGAALVAVRGLEKQEKQMRTELKTRTKAIQAAKAADNL